MSSLLLKYNFSLEQFLPEPVNYLNRITARPIYIDGKRTSDISGYVYLVTNTDSFHQYSVYVPSKEPLLTEEELEMKQQRGEKVFVEFTNAVLKPYFSERTRSLEDSIRADSITIVNKEI